MKSSIKKLIAGALCAASIGAISACGASKSNSTKDRLYIVYYPGGYGKEWLTEFTKEFVAQYKNKPVSEVKENVDYYLKADPNCTASTDAYLTLKDKAPDIIFGGQPAATAIQQGRIEPLDDLYNEDIELSAGGSKQTVKLKDYLTADTSLVYKRQYIYQKEQEHYFALPLTSIPLSMAYNETILKATPHVDANGSVSAECLSGGNWNVAPVTFDDLIAYFKDIESANETKEKKITPFAWCTANSNWFEALYVNWWAETQGLYTSLVDGQGSYYDFWNRESPELYKQTGLLTAFGKVKELLYDADGNMQYTYESQDPFQIGGTWCQSNFAEGNAAICLTGDFFEKEYYQQLEANSDVFKMMAIPSITDHSGLVNPDSQKIEKMVYVNSDSSAYIPFNSPNKEMAKGFLKYISEEKQVIRFTEMTGCIRPYNCDVRALSTKTDWTAYQQSALDLYFGADERVCKFPKTKTNPISPIYIYEADLRTSFLCDTSYTQSITRLQKYSPQEVLIDGIWNTFESVYEGAVKRYTNSTTGLNKIYAKWLATQK